jgi:hypothetical protein
MILNSPIISGSLTVTGNIITSGSITLSGSVASASYASNADLLDGLDSTVFTLTSSFNAQTASFTAFTASLNAFSASILSYTSSINAKTASFATTGSNTFIGTQTITGSVLQSGSFTTTGTIIAQTINVQQVTSSTVYSSGSNIFGNDIGNSQTFTGSVLITGSLTIAGASSATSYSGTTIYGSTAVCSPVGKFTSCIDAGSGYFSGCVGIGIISPNATLSVKTDTNANGINIWGRNDDFAVLRFQNASGTQSNATIYATPTYLAFETAATERMRITSCGNVGIGINSPLRKLHIFNNDDTRGILIQNCSTTSYAELHFCASREFRIGTGGTATVSEACNKFYIYDATSSAHRFTIDCIGRIGIGIATPSELLHVCGNIRAGNIDNGTNFAGTSPYVGIGGSTPLFLVHSSGYGVGYFGYDTGGDRLIIATDNGGGNNKIDFSVNAGTSTDGSTNNVSGIAYAMRINGSGYIIKPYQPAFKAGRSSNISVGANSTIVFNDTSGNHFNTGGHYSTSTGMFTAPVAGKYIFSTLIIYQSLSNGQAMDDAFYIYKNADLVTYSFRRAEYELGYTGNGGYYTDHANILLDLAVGDTV